MPSAECRRWRLWKISRYSSRQPQADRLVPAPHPRLPASSDNVELDEATVSVRQIRTDARYEVLTLTLKTDKGARTIALDPETVAALRTHRVTQVEERLILGPRYRDSGDVVFTNEDGSPIHPERLSAFFGHHCARSGLPAIRLHDVRHSYVTALLGERVPLKVVSQRVGHASR